MRKNIKIALSGIPTLLLVAGLSATSVANGQSRPPVDPMKDKTQLPTPQREKGEFVPFGDAKKSEGAQLKAPTMTATHVNCSEQAQDHAACKSVHAQEPSYVKAQKLQEPQ